MSWFLLRGVLCVCIIGSELCQAQAGSCSAPPYHPDQHPLPWFSSPLLEFSSRYAYADLRKGDVTDREMEYRMTSIMRLRLAANTNTYLQLRGQSGNAF